MIAPDGRTVYIAGQVAFDSTGKVVGEGDFAAQAEQVSRNLEHALKSVGGSMADLVKTTTFITDIKHLSALREVRTRYLAKTQPPANTPGSGFQPGAVRAADRDRRRGAAWVDRAALGDRH